MSVCVPCLSVYLTPSWPVLMDEPLYQGPTVGVFPARVDAQQAEGVKWPGAAQQVTALPPCLGVLGPPLSLPGTPGAETAEALTRPG